MTPSEEDELVDLVGRKCTVAASIGGQDAMVLWDTRSQVSIINHRWMKEIGLNTKVKDVSELLGEHILL